MMMHRREAAAVRGERPVVAWEVDRSPLPIRDGSDRCAVYGVVDVSGGRFEAMASSLPAATALHLLLSARLAEWGVPDEVRMDHGLAVKGRNLGHLGVRLSVPAPNDVRPAGRAERLLHALLRDLRAEPDLTDEAACAAWIRRWLAARRHQTQPI